MRSLACKSLSMATQRRLSCNATKIRGKNMSMLRLTNEPQKNTANSVTISCFPLTTFAFTKRKVKKSLQTTLRHRFNNLWRLAHHPSPGSQQAHINDHYRRKWLRFFLPTLRLSASFSSLNGDALRHVLQISVWFMSSDPSI